jgi:hypothetical protein
VIEFQERGSVHFHVVIRLDGVDPDDPAAIVQAGGEWATVEVLEEAIRAAAERAQVVAPDGRRIAWGGQLDIEPIGAGDGTEDGRLDSDDGSEKIPQYVTKACGRIASYTTKGAEAAGTVDHAIWCRSCKGTGRSDASDERAKVDPDTGEIGLARVGDASRLSVGAADRECDRCAGSGLRQSIESLDVNDHVRSLIETCWELGGDPLYARLNLRRWAHQLGYGGHFATHSRRYSTTLTALRQVRRDYCTGHTLARAGLNRATPVVRLRPGAGLDDIETRAAPAGSDLVVIVGHWRYHGRGHSPGERMWAHSVAEGIADNRRLAREARMDLADEPDEDWEAA